MNILALDLSLTHTGWARCIDGVRTFGSLCEKTKGHSRVENLRHSVSMLTTDTSLVVIEGPAFGAKGRAVFDIAGMRGVITHSLWMDGMPYVEVPPSVLKKYVTGKGNANKDAMIAAAIRSLGFEGFDNNEADAWCLLHMASQHYDYGDAVKPAYRAEMLAKVDWPTF